MIFPLTKYTLLFATWQLQSGNDRGLYDLSSTRATARFLPGAKKRQVAVLGEAMALPSSIEFPMSLLRVSLFSRLFIVIIGTMNVTCCYHHCRKILIL